MLFLCRESRPKLYRYKKAVGFGIPVPEHQKVDVRVKRVSVREQLLKNGCAAQQPQPQTKSFENPSIFRRQTVSSLAIRDFSGSLRDLVLKDEDEKSQESSPERTARRNLMMRRQATESDLNSIF